MSREEFIQKFFPGRNKDFPSIRIGGFSCPALLNELELDKNMDFAQLKELALARYQNAYESLLVAWQKTIAELERAELTQ